MEGVHAQQEEVHANQEEMNGAALIPIAVNEEHNQQVECLESLEKMLPLYKFSPTDADLIVLFLDAKIKGEVALPLHKIHDANIYDYSPDDLTSQYRSWGEGNWYFFTPRFRKYLHGTRPKREAEGGYWKATGGDKIIYDKKNNVVGLKKVLVFYTGKSKESKVSQGNNTKWVMNEYTVKERKPVVDDENPWLLDKCVLCKIYEKGGWIENSLHEREKVSRRRKMPSSHDKNQVANFDGFPISMQMQEFIYSPDYTSLLPDQMLFLDFDNLPLSEEMNAKKQLQIKM